MGTLYIVSTPIGNLGDLSARAGEVLQRVDRILAEDTRRSRVIANAVGSAAPLSSLHQHNEHARTQAVLGWLDAGEELALVSDAGTPLVSDPGESLVAAVTGAGHTVVPIPGPSAVLSALIGSGLPAARFAFLGFIARKGKERRADLMRVGGTDETLVLFESPNRLVRLLEDLRAACGDERRVAVARELTKVHEEFVRGTVVDVLHYYEENSPRGEVTVVVAPADNAPQDGGVLEKEAAELARALLADGGRASAVSKEIARRLAIPRNEAYRIVLDLDVSER